MPILIDEIIAEVSDNVTEPAEAAAEPLQVPLAKAEQETMQVLALIRQRQDRLRID